MAKKVKLEGASVRVMPTPLGIKVEYDNAESLTPSDVKKALLAAVEAIPASKLKGFTNGRLTLVV